VKKSAELARRRELLIGKIAAERDMLSHYVARLEAPAHWLETSWRVTRFFRSPLVVAALSLIMQGSRRQVKHKRRKLPWYLGQGWRLFTALKTLGR
jgi:hypothetical protein